LVALARERRYLLVDEMIEALALSADVNSPEEVNELLSTFERSGINGYDDVPRQRRRTSFLNWAGRLKQKRKKTSVGSGSRAEPDARCP
jgi:hypothetical protein